MRVRIGIDVGGTFTDAVAVDDETYQLIGSAKIPTTHESKDGVAAGIILVLKTLMEKYGIKPADVVFIAHGTTQATNALLEGDVSHVGIITLGSGLEGMKAKADTKMGQILLSEGKYLHTDNVFISNSDVQKIEDNLKLGLSELSSKNCECMVATEAFSVDNPANENLIVNICTELGFPATAGNDVTKLYGLKIRTRTAVVNASIMPKMLDTANMTESSIKKAQISAPLMVMRCDGGVMTMDEVRSRPILTILSGPAAGVAGALMYEKLTDGIFFEVGGTSTDISCVRDGSVMIKYAEVGGHKTYLNSLDVRTVGIGGGSMVKMKDGRAVDVGPRSSHIANLEYEVYQKEEDIVNPVLKTLHPVPSDPEYAYIECSNGKKFALTLSGAANVAGYVPETDYAKGNTKAAIKAWKPLAEKMGLSVEDTAKKVLEFSAKKNGKVVEALIDDYGLNRTTLQFMGGGGGSSTVVPHLAETFHMNYKIAKNSEVISPIGVALALVREMVERTVMKPTEEDILSIRQEVFQKAVKSGANSETVEIKVEIDTQMNKLRAIAIGATELRSKQMGSAKKTEKELRTIISENAHILTENVEVVATNGFYYAMQFPLVEKKWGLFKKKSNSVRLVDSDGVIRLQRKDGKIHHCTIANWKTMVEYLLEEYTVCGDGGDELPNIFVTSGSRIIDLSGMQSRQQVYALLGVELAEKDPKEDIICLCTLTSANKRG